MPRALIVVCALICAFALRLEGQQPVQVREPPGFDFRPGGVWRPKARGVMLARQRALSTGNLSQLNAPVGRVQASGGSSMAVGGILRMPVMLVSFLNTPAGSLRAVNLYSDALGSTAPAGRPYSLRTYYEEISQGALSVRPEATGWLALDSNDTWYAGTQNGRTSTGKMWHMISNAVRLADATVDFGQFDNDGDDGIPNSGDDDGVVDIFGLVHPEVGGECSANGSNGNIWAHRFRASGWSPTIIATNDARTGGGFIRVDDYIVQGGVGGRSGCDDADLMGIGIIAHELGHGLDLPDFYDVIFDDSDQSQGIGHWGLMGAGNYRDAFSPAYMEGFSRLQLGWVTVRDVAASAVITLGAYPTSDSIIRIRPSGSNPRGEYFLLENRQAVLSDSVVVRDKAPGLLVWHVDSLKYQQGFFSNTVNTGAIHALALAEADGIGNLLSSTAGVSNRGDGGDPFPGLSNNRRFAFSSLPGARLNNGAFAGFMIDSIAQTVPAGEIRFRVTVGQLTVVRGADSTAVVYVRGQPHHPFRDLFADGDTATISADALHVSADGRTEFTFGSWSDGQARTHQVNVGSAGQTITASFSRRFSYAFGTTGAGAITASSGAPSGTFLEEGDSLTLTAAGDATFAFLGWIGDTVTSNAAIKLRATRPWSVTARFEGLLVVSDSLLRPGIAGAVFNDTLRMTGGIGTFTFAVLPGLGTLPHGLSLSASGIITGTPSRDSTYAFTVRVTSGAQTMDLPLRMVVAAPALTVQGVVNQLLYGGFVLSAAEQEYLDLIGNNNNAFDIGDLTAWLDRSGQTLSPALTRRLMERRAR